MALLEFVCTRCDAKFVQGKWNCKDGQAHTVAEKIYFVPSEGLAVYYTQQIMVPNAHGQAQIIPAKRLEFIRGTYTTSDSEKQAFLDNYAGCVSREVWEQTHIPLKERQAKVKRELAASEQNMKTANAQLEQLRADIAAAQAVKDSLVPADAVQGSK
jgi:hypothetical protein